VWGSTLCLPGHTAEIYCSPLGSSVVTTFSENRKTHTESIAVQVISFTYVTSMHLSCILGCGYVHRRFTCLTWFGAAVTCIQIEQPVGCSDCGLLWLQAYTKACTKPRLTSSKSLSTYHSR
jgi:hypothetical protein